MPDYGTPENPYIISIPNWDDYIKIHPRLQWWDNTEIAKKDWAIYFSYKERDKLDEILHIPKYREIHRRAQRIEALKASPTPEIFRTIAQIMTWIDDAEDTLSTGLVVGKMLVKKLPWLAARVGTRFIPILGWILTVRDLMEILPILWRMLRMGKSGKKSSFDIISPINWKRRTRMKRVARFLRRKPGIPELIEAAQATEFLFGTGLQIGPAIGMIQNAVWGGIRAAGGATVKIKYPEGWREAPDLDRIMNGLDSASRLTALQPEPFQDVHMIALAALALGIQVLQPITNSDTYITRSDEAMGWNVHKKAPWEPMTRVILEAHGIDPDRDEPHTFPDMPQDLSYGEYADRLRIRAPDILRFWKDMFPAGETGVFVSGTMMEFALWVWNCDLPVEEWELNEPAYIIDPPEALLLETIETGERPPLEEEYTKDFEPSAFCEERPDVGWPDLLPHYMSYIDEIEKLVEDYDALQGYYRRTKIGSVALKNLIRCHFGKTMDKSLIPTTSPF